ncbi:MAG TPA: glutamate--tRNA ligase [Terriglobia bacterium]|nr:glutamate--tRNA ligase [Terriglobia bacterium]
MAEIRVRFAPSPTGYLHVGGARTALYNWLYARRQNGVLILRIEDTDADRSKPELVTAILESLEWLGLGWDEGPFHQSDRLDRYRALAAELERQGHAYPCFCTPEELQAKRAAAGAGRPWKYDRTCRKLSEPERQRRLAEKMPYVLRFRVPETGETTFDDQVFGGIKVENEEIEDFVLLRSDGQPTYHLSVVADDVDMRITHVIRGADHLSNTPKQIFVYRALGAAEPIFAHLPLILGPDRQRLSKRHGATSVGAYRDQGILPEALINFLALLGWTPPGGEEIVPLAEMVRAFELAAVSKSNAVFDPEKLAWMNSQYLRGLSMDRLLPLIEAELKAAGVQPATFASGENFRQAVALLQTRARTLKDFSQGGRAFFTDDFEYEPEARKKFWKDPALHDLLSQLAERLEKLEGFDLAQTEGCLRQFAEERGIKAGLLINAARVALTGQAVAPGLFEVMHVLGRERTARRLRRAADHVSSSASNNP